MTVISILTACAVLIQSYLADENKAKISVGIVGNTDDTFIQIGLNVIENDESSNYYIDLIDRNNNNHACPVSGLL